MAKENERTAAARRHDDSAIIDEAMRAPSGAGRSGGNVATDIGTRDEVRQAVDPSAGVTRVSKGDKVQPQIPTRSDHEGASTGHRE